MTALRALIDTALYLPAVGAAGYAVLWFLGKAMDWALDVEGEAE